MRIDTAPLFYCFDLSEIITPYLRLLHNTALAVLCNGLIRVCSQLQEVWILSIKRAYRIFHPIIISFFPSIKTI